MRRFFFDFFSASGNRDEEGWILYCAPAAAQGRGASSAARKRPTAWYRDDLFFHHPARRDDGEKKKKGSKILAVSHSVECGPRAWVYDRQKSIGKQWMEWNESRRGSSSLSSFAPSLLFLLLFFTPFCHHNRPILIAEQGVLLTPWFE